MNYLELSFLAKQLKLCLQCGGQVPEALRDLAEVTVGHQQRQILEELATDCADGTSLSDAVSSRKQYFLDPFAEFVRTGEEANNLVEVLGYATDYFQRIHRFERSKRAALFYPLVIVSATFILLLFDLCLWGYHSSLFHQIVAGIGGDYPISPGIVAVILLLGLMVLFAGGFNLSKRSIYKRLLIYIPVIGQWFLGYVLEPIALLTSVLMKAGVPLHRALFNADKSLGQNVISIQIMSFCEDLQDGSDPVKALQSKSPFPPFFTDMLVCGLEQGNPGKMFRDLADHYRLLNTRYRSLVTPMLYLVSLVTAAAFVLLLVYNMYYLFYSLFFIISDLS